MTGTVRGLHVNPEGGVPKHPVQQLIVGYEGCQGDKQNDRKHHGGPQRAVCLMETWVLKRLQDEGHHHPGSTGENMLNTVHNQATSPLVLDWSWVPWFWN